jgi:predicted MPP superfamily phosphohydrolase
VDGNHELALEDATYQQLIRGLTKLGVTVLNNRTATIEWGEESIWLVGTPWGSTMYRGELSRIEGYRILLTHDPAFFESYTEYGYNLVLTGHVHGGQFRLPLVGGLYGPGQGILPEYDSGLYQSQNTQMVVSRGIGNSVFPIRFANRPEVILITLKT